MRTLRGKIKVIKKKSQGEKSISQIYREMKSKFYQMCLLGDQILKKKKSVNMSNLAIETIQMETFHTMFSYKTNHKMVEFS